MNYGSSKFRTTSAPSNDFYGSEIGLRTQIYRGRWSLEILTKVAIGNTHQIVTIDGQTDETATGTDADVQRRNLRRPTNSGTYPRDEFTMIPQLGLELGYQVSCHWRAYVGYDSAAIGDRSRGPPNKST